MNKLSLFRNYMLHPLFGDCIPQHAIAMVGLLVTGITIKMQLKD